MATQHSLGELAGLVTAELQGDASCMIAGVATLKSAQSGQISFLHNPKYRQYLSDTKASAVILGKEEAAHCPVGKLVVANPHYAYTQIAALYLDRPTVNPGIADSAIVHPSAQIDESAHIGAQSVIGANVRIGPGVIIGPGCVVGEGSSIGAGSRLWAKVTIYDKVQIGERVNLHAGVVIGADGFGLAKQGGVWHNVPQLGGVVIGDEVDIGANSTIDRGALENTEIGNGVKIDNLVQIGHNVIIGDYTAIAGCVGIAGSTKIGVHCIIGGAACIAGHLDIADDVTITGMAGVSRSLPKAGIYSSGTSVQPYQEWRKNSARFHHLDVIARRLRSVERQLQSLAEEQDDYSSLG